MTTLLHAERRNSSGKRVLVLLGVVAGLASAGLAEAPRAEAARKWYWSEPKAETRLKQRDRSVRTATCVGIDARSIFVNGRELHRGFFCSGELWNGVHYQITLYPRGKRRFIWFPF